MLRLCKMDGHAAALSGRDRGAEDGIEDGVVAERLTQTTTESRRANGGVPLGVRRYMGSAKSAPRCLSYVVTVVLLLMGAQTIPVAATAAPPSMGTPPQCSGGLPSQSQVTLNPWSEWTGDDNEDAEEEDDEEDGDDGRPFMETAGANGQINLQLPNFVHHQGCCGVASVPNIMIASADLASTADVCAAACLDDPNCNGFELQRGESAYSGSDPGFSPNHTMVYAGSTLRWATDSTVVNRGWKLCAKAPVPGTAYFSVVSANPDGACVTDAAQACVATSGRLYTNNEACKIRVEATSELVAEWWDTERLEDTLAIPTPPCRFFTGSAVPDSTRQGTACDQTSCYAALDNTTLLEIRVEISMDDHDLSSDDQHELRATVACQLVVLIGDSVTLSDIVRHTFVSDDDEAVLTVQFSLAKVNLSHTTAVMASMVGIEVLAGETICITTSAQVARVATRAPTPYPTTAPSGSPTVSTSRTIIAPTVTLAAHKDSNPPSPAPTDTQGPTTQAPTPMPTLPAACTIVDEQVSVLQAEVNQGGQLGRKTRRGILVTPGITGGMDHFVKHAGCCGLSSLGTATASSDVGACAERCTRENNCSAFELKLDATRYSGNGFPPVGATAVANGKVRWHTDASVERDGFSICAENAVENTRYFELEEADPPGACFTFADGTCITDGSNDYKPHERCTFKVLETTRLVVDVWQVENVYDYLEIDAEPTCVLQTEPYTPRTCSGTTCYVGIDNTSLSFLRVEFGQPVVERDMDALLAAVVCDIVVRIGGGVTVKNVVRQWVNDSVIINVQFRLSDVPSLTASRIADLVHTSDPIIVDIAGTAYSSTSAIGGNAVSPNPTPAPTDMPSHFPTSFPTVAPSAAPTNLPTKQPSSSPTANPTHSPAASPTLLPTLSPTTLPTRYPTATPTGHPSGEPTVAPSETPTGVPSTIAPTVSPTYIPSDPPTISPTTRPSLSPTTPPTKEPTPAPTVAPTAEPTPQPSLSPTSSPTDAPTADPTVPLTGRPSGSPTAPPTSIFPTASPTGQPSVYPSTSPPSSVPTTLAPTQVPTSVVSTNCTDNSSTVSFDSAVRAPLQTVEYLASTSTNLSDSSSSHCEHDRNLEVLTAAIATLQRYADEASETQSFNYSIRALLSSVAHIMVTTVASGNVSAGLATTSRTVSSNAINVAITVVGTEARRSGNSTAMVVEASDKLVRYYAMGYGNLVGPNRSGELIQLADNATVAISATRMQWTSNAKLSVSLPTSFDGVDADSAAGITVWEFSTVHPTKNTGSVVGPILEINVANRSGSFGGAGRVVLSFPLNRVTNVTYTCAFYHEASSTWRVDGCVTDVSSADAVRCECNHLTSFAVLADISGPEGEASTAISEEHLQSLSIVTYLGVGLSIACLIVVLVLNSLVMMGEAVPLQTRTIHHLVGVYLVSMVLFLLAIGYGQTGRDDNVCAAIGGLLHYFLLASFCWMAVEGQVLYKMFVVVFYLTSKAADGERLRIYAYLAYGAPLGMVVVMAAAFPNEYGNHGSGICWLSPGINGPIWAFVGPAIVLAIANCGVLVTILRHLSGAKQAEKRFKVHIALTFATIMGITWGCAILMLSTDGPTLTVVSYAFTILNAFSGVWIFLFHGGVNKAVWHKAINEVKKMTGTRRASKTGTIRGVRGTLSSSGGALTLSPPPPPPQWSADSKSSPRSSSARSPGKDSHPGSNSSDRGPAWARSLRQTLDNTSDDSGCPGTPWARAKRPSMPEEEARASSGVVPWARRKPSEPGAAGMRTTDCETSTNKDGASSTVLGDAAVASPRCSRNDILINVMSAESIHSAGLHQCTIPKAAPLPLTPEACVHGALAFLRPLERRSSVVWDLDPQWPQWDNEQLQEHPLSALSKFIAASRVRTVDLFNAMDRERKGWLADTDMVDALLDLRIPIAEASVIELTDSIARNANGVITFRTLKQSLNDHTVADREARKQRKSWTHHPQRQYSIATGRKVSRRGPVDTPPSRLGAGRHYNSAASLAWDAHTPVLTSSRTKRGNELLVEPTGAVHAAAFSQEERQSPKMMAVGEIELPHECARGALQPALTETDTALLVDFRPIVDLINVETVDAIPPKLSEVRESSLRISSV